MSPITEYQAIVRAAISSAGVPARLSNETTDVVVLERLARSAGSTNWYLIRTFGQLDEIMPRLSPGSLLSFYFDGRMVTEPYDAERTRTVVAGILRRDPDVVIGRLMADGHSFAVDFVSSEAELADFVDGLLSDAYVIYGAFPGRDNDGVQAITMQLPDADGIVRPHPH